MAMKKVWAWLGGLVTLILAGYIVALIQGIPLSGIAGVVWWFVRAAISSVAGWLTAPAQVSHARLILLIALTAGIVFIVTKRRYSQPPIREVPTDFDPTAVQLLVMHWMLKMYNNPVTLGDLWQRSAVLTAAVGGNAFLVRQMEGLERASIIRKHGTATGLYYLTPQGRDWMLDQLERAASEQKSPSAPAKAIEDFEPSRVQTLAAAFFWKPFRVAFRWRTSQHA